MLAKEGCFASSLKEWKQHKNDAVDATVLIYIAVSI